jgi:hypothetical protein
MQKKITKNIPTRRSRIRGIITAGTTLEKIINIKGAEKVLAKYRVPCISCPMAPLELDKLKIGQVCKIYNLDLEGILEALNKLK